MSCPVCEKRKAVRFCPAKAEKICAVCCGTEREVTIDCPVDCSYLAAAHRYEDQQQRALPPDTPFLEDRIPGGVIQEHQQLMAALAFTIAKFSAAQPPTVDPDVLAALQALAETYKTLGSGLYYERPPVLPLPKDLYAALTGFLNDIKQKASAAGLPPLGTPTSFTSWCFSSVWACSAPMAARARVASSSFFAASSRRRPSSSARNPASSFPDVCRLRRQRHPAPHAAGSSALSASDSCGRATGLRISSHGRPAKSCFCRIFATRSAIFRRYSSGA